MGLADRYYMRDDGADRKLNAPVWLVILVVNVLVFFAGYSQGNRSFALFMEYGALSLEGIKHGMVWQFLTFQFLHAGMSHLVLNSLVLFFFGRAIEQMLGKVEFLKLYLLSGFAGGGAQLLLALVSDRFAGPMVGASAGICGLVAAFALLNPNSTIYLFLVLPVRALYFLPLVIAVSLALLLLPANDSVAHGAHLGGILAGIAYVRWGEILQSRLSQWRLFPPHQQRRHRFRAASDRTSRWPRSRPEPPADLPSEEFISREVDPILDKISAHGIQSLTERERQILEKARSKMAKP